MEKRSQFGGLYNIKFYAIGFLIGLIIGIALTFLIAKGIIPLNLPFSIC